MRIYLVGYMGSGKTATGKKLAAEMRYPFIDMDEQVVLQTGKTISEIFETYGEDFFREQEHRALLHTAGLHRAVVATGGGTPCFNNQMQWMNENGITVYLEASEGLLFHRLASEKENRPLIAKLSDVELMEQIQLHYYSRKKTYEQALIKISAAKVSVSLIKQRIKSMKTRK